MMFTRNEGSDDTSRSSVGTEIDLSTVGFTSSRSFSDKNVKFLGSQSRGTYIFQYLPDFLL
jgi:hypothetical protein